MKELPKVAAANEGDSALQPLSNSLSNDVLDTAPQTIRAEAPSPEPGPSPSASPEPGPDDQPGASNDSATLLRKFSVHPTSSRRLQGLKDVALMLLALLPTAVMRLVRAALGLFGVTEHRWRGISMAVPLSREDRTQLELTASNLVAGRLGRRPDPPERGPVPPALQLLLDTHAILAATASTAAAFGLPYEGMPEAALQAKLASYLRSIAAGEEVCTQDCFKAMRKLGRKALLSLCSAPASHAPARPPKPRAVVKAFIAACLMQHSRSHATTLIQLVTRLPEQAADLVETVSLIPLAAGAEYLRLLAAAGADGGGDAGAGSFAEQLETMAEFGRLRPSDAKKEPGVQGMAINARVHEVGVVRRAGACGGEEAAGGAASGVGGGRKAGPKPCANGAAAVAEGTLPPIHGVRSGGSGAEEGGRGTRVSSGGLEDISVGVSRGSGGGGSGSGRSSLNGGRTWPNGFRTLRDARQSSSGGSDRGYGGDTDVDDVTEGLLVRTRKELGGTSSQPDLQPPQPRPATPPAAPASASPDPSAADPTVTLALASANGTSARPRPPASSSSSACPVPSFPSGPSISIAPYPPDALDAFSPLYGCPRSGAFALHGRQPRGVGLSRLVTSFASVHAMPLPAQRALLRGLGFGSVEALRREVELRKALCVAQALPVVLASLRLMCRSPACLRAAARTGSFAHVQLSLLSDLHRHERGYLEDTRGALDVLADRLALRFVAGSEKVLPLQLSGGSITVSLPADCVSDSALAAAGLDRSSFLAGSYGLVALLFNQGVNSLQSLGFLTAPWGAVEPLQDTLNRHSLERLNEYAARAGAAGGPALAALNAHYGPEGRRAPKDTEMFGLLRRACSEVGAGRAVNCKSGKDRTALELAAAFADEVLSAGLLPDSPGCRSWLAGQFLRGLSYVTTSQNHGQPPAYAFNEMEILTLPTGWRPDWRLCGKVAT